MPLSLLLSFNFFQLPWYHVLPFVPAAFCQLFPLNSDAMHLSGIGTFCQTKVQQEIHQWLSGGYFCTEIRRFRANLSLSVPDVIFFTPCFTVCTARSAIPLEDGPNVITISGIQPRKNCSQSLNIVASAVASFPTSNSIHFE